jgi:hypothetical protein
VEAGPIWNGGDAAAKCPNVCKSYGSWTGQWWTTVQGKMSVCECVAAAPQGPVRPAGPHITIYADGGFAGALQFLEPGRYDIAQLSIGNDTLSSLQVPQGLKVTLYEHGGFTGRTREFREDAGWVGNDFNDITSGIVVEFRKGGWKTAPPPPPPPPPAPEPPAAPAPGPVQSKHLRLQWDTYRASELINLEWRDMPATSSAWVNVVPKGAATDEWGKWTYTRKATGTFAVGKLPPGEYEARAYHESFGEPADQLFFFVVKD